MCHSLGRDGTRETELLSLTFPDSVIVSIDPNTERQINTQHNLRTGSLLSESATETVNACDYFCL